MQEKFLNLKREILDLKTGHDFRSNMRTFLASIPVPDMDDYAPTTLRVTYADGDQPIMTTTIGDPALIPLTPSGNQQDFYLAAGDSNYSWWEITFYFLSTRKIESIAIIQ